MSTNQAWVLTRFAGPNPGSVQEYYIPSTTQLGSTCPKHITFHRTGGGPLFQEAARHYSKLLEMMEKDPTGTDPDTVQYLTEKRDRALAQVKE